MTTNNSNTTNGGTIVINSTGFTGGTVTIGTGGWFTVPIFYPEPAPVKEKKKDDRDGCDCKKCKEFYPYAEPNQEDGTLICYACRHGY